MSIVYLYRDPDDIGGNAPATLDDDRVRLYTLDVTANAEEGSVATSSIVLDDPDGDLDLIGHRVFAVKETAVAAASNSFIYVGYTGARKISRGPHRTLAGRQWELTVVDVNTVLERRVMTGADCNRPAETDVARVQWLEATNEGSLITDTRFLSTASPVAMDAADYRGQSFKSILDDCAQQSGKNYFLTHFADIPTTANPWGRYSLWYDFLNSTAYSSGLRLSNVLSDVDSVTTFAVSQEDTVLTRDPSRVYSGVYMPYDGGAAYVQNSTTAGNFARRDAVAPAENVKTNAKAVARANRYLADIDTEEDIIQTAIEIPAALVNELREGMRVRSRFSHLPGYESGMWLRLLNRNVTQLSEEKYKIKMELGSTGSPADNIGDTIGGYLCSANGYVVPWCAGGGALLTATVGGTNPSTGTVKLYDGATYRFVYTAEHHWSAPAPGDNDLGGAVGATVFGTSTTWESKANTSDTRVIFGHETPLLPGGTTPNPPRLGVTFDATMGSNGSPCVPVRAFEGAGVFTHNVTGSIVTCLVTYVSGPDPRFVGLVGCPFP